MRLSFNVVQNNKFSKNYALASALSPTARANNCSTGQKADLSIAGPDVETRV